MSILTEDLDCQVNFEHCIITVLGVDIDAGMERHFRQFIKPLNLDNVMERVQAELNRLMPHHGWTVSKVPLSRKNHPETIIKMEAWDRTKQSISFFVHFK